MTAALDRLARQPVGDAKGFPASARELTVAEIRNQQWRLHDQLSTPIAVLDDTAVEHNLATMARWCADRGVELHPHGKTTMAPQLFARQLGHGATGLTAATPAQVRTMRACGVGAIQLANEVTQPREIAWIVAELANDDGFEFLCWVDSASGVELLQAAADGSNVTVDVLLEIGAPGGRAGCRTAADRARVVEAVAKAPNVRLVGVSGYEGAVAGNRSPEALDTVRSYLGQLREAADELATADTIDRDAPVMLTAGGSMFFDLVVEVLTAGWAPGAARVVLRSGCYLTHDSGAYHRNSPLDLPDDPTRLRAALTVWGTVLSRPEPDLAILDVGRRDISFDQGLPVPLRRLPIGGSAAHGLRGATVKALNDQHAYVRLGDSRDVEVGDRVQLGVSHPCTTLDKWRLIPVVDGDDVVVDAVATCF